MTSGSIPSNINFSNSVKYLSNGAGNNDFVTNTKRAAYIIETDNIPSMVT
ncbi:hypothetical protein WJU16_10710 [Chitinophaga pollutisoli]|uniref:Uncharacterized protein n=1 Tax=Chitinophaga pollutisoli TaxID=3133966 RepID=A0ABZ2YUL2_9BACT